MEALFQVFGIQALKLRKHEPSVPAHQNAVEVHFPAAVFGGLNAYQIPVERGLVPIVAFVIACARGKVEAAHYLFIEQGVLHGVYYVRVYADCELAHGPRALVHVKYMVHALGVVSRCVYNPAVFKGKADVFKREAVVHRGRVVGYHAVYAALYRRCKYLAVRYVYLAGAFYGWKPLY